MNKDSTKVAIIIDAFRAFATAAYVLEQNPTSYILTTKCDVISRLSLNLYKPLLIGKPEKGSSLEYDIPNSPTRVKKISVINRNVLHRTEAGAKGVLLAKEVDHVFVAGFINADATVEYLKTLPNPKVVIIPMGHEARSPTLEDDLCAKYIKELISNKKFDLAPFISKLKNGSGRYFFSDDKWQYPSEDFERCLKIGRFNFAIRAKAYGDHSILTRSDIDRSKKKYLMESAVIRPGNL